MKLAQIIKWVDDTNKQFERSTEVTRECIPNKGYQLENEPYKYAVTDYFLQMDKSNKTALVKRLFYLADEISGQLREYKEKCLESNPAYRWVEDFAYELVTDIKYEDSAFDALFADILRFYYEIIKLCIDSEILVEELLHPYYQDVWHDVIEFAKDVSDYSRNNGGARIPRIKRIAALKHLLEQMKVPANIDKTQIATFIEAITGGDTSITAKNTYTYRNYNSIDKDKGRELLNIIGIEIK